MRRREGASKKQRKNSQCGKRRNQESGVPEVKKKGEVIKMEVINYVKFSRGQLRRAAGKKKNHYKNKCINK